MDFTNDALVNEDEAGKNSPMKEYFQGKVILLTGGTGFLGQLYVEKLLRSNVKIIYLLTRAKKGKQPEERTKELFAGMHFNKLLKHDPNYLQRIRIIEGDLSQLGLAISEADLNDIYENVEIILHAAADVRFDEKLLKLLMTNLRGTRELLKIAEKIKKLQVFSYISTAFSNCYRSEIDEQFYEPPVDPVVAIEFAEDNFETNSEEVEILTDRIIDPWPNTYTYTKCLSEDLLKQYCDKFPICIIRPTIVISTFEDPVPAWCNNIYGLNGVLVACGMGVLRLMPLNKKIVGDVVCADFVINSTLAAIWVTYEEQRKQKAIVKPEIYHVCTCVDRPATWGQITDDTNERCCEFPPSRTLWKQCPNTTTCPFLWKYLTIMYHFIPGVITDMVFSMIGKKLRLMPVYRKVQRFMDALKFFMQHEWKFTNSNMKRVLSKMTSEDQEFFPSDVRRYDWATFSYNYVLGLRNYMSQENLGSIEYARQRYNRFRFFHIFVLMIYYGFHFGIFWLIATKLNLFENIQNSLIDTYMFLKDPK